MISNTKFSIEQYQTFTGWGNYEDDETSNLVIGTTPIKFTVNSLGATGSITVPVYNTTVELSKTVPFSKGYSLLAFARDTFLANNGQIFLSTDAGAITIVSRAIFIKRDHRGRNGI